MANLNELLRKPITTIAEGKAWIEELTKEGLLFHFEDSPEEVGNTVDGEWVRLFTDEECSVARAQVERLLYGFEWAEFTCPIGYALHVMGE